jgi:xanthine/uracil permease
MGALIAASVLMGTGFLFVAATALAYWLENPQDENVDTALGACVMCAVTALVSAFAAGWLAASL